MKVLVTGGSGFIGQHAINALLASGKVTDVVSLDLNPSLTRRVWGDSVRTELGDIRNLGHCLRAADGASAIIHLAAVASVPASIGDPRTTHETNATGTLNILEAARSQSECHVVVASSSAVYGEHPATQKDESLPTQYLTPYAASKGATEGYALAYAASYGIPTTAFRFFNVFGPGQTADHPYAAVIPLFLDAIRRSEPLRVFGDGRQTRDFIPVHTVADALVKAALRGLSSTLPINVAAGHSISVNQLIEDLARIHGKPLKVEYHAERLGDIRHSGADISNLHELIEDLDDTAFLPALREVYEWHLA